MTAVLHASTTRESEWRGRKRYIVIAIHETDKAFKKAAERYSPNVDWADAVGAFHPTSYRERFDPKTKKWVCTSSSSFAGVIRLSKDFLDTDVVIHECVHASATIYRMDVRRVVNLGRDCFETEEMFSYIVGDVAASVSHSLHKAGVW